MSSSSLSRKTLSDKERKACEEWSYFLLKLYKKRKAASNGQ